jgi:hypothetical protein
MMFDRSPAQLERELRFVSAGPGSQSTPLSVGMVTGGVQFTNTVFCPDTRSLPVVFPEATFLCHRFGW